MISSPFSTFDIYFVKCWRASFIPALVIYVTSILLWLPTSVHNENMIINQILRLAHPHFLTKFLVVIARSWKRRSNLKYTEGLLHFVRNDTPQRVIARSSNDEAISSTQGDCFTSFAMTPLNGSLRGVVTTKQSTTIQRGCFTSFAMTRN